MQEPSTGIFFPGTLPQNSKLKLITVGLRKKLLFNVYAFGIYADPHDCKRLLSEWKDVKPEDLANENKFFDVFLEDTWDKALVLVTARKIKGELLSEAFNVSLLERINKIGLKVSENDIKEEVTPLVALESFKSQFIDRKIPKSTKITLEWKSGGQLITSIDSDEVGRLVSPTFCTALYDIFIGENAIDTKAKKAIANKVHLILNDKNHSEEDIIIPPPPQSEKKSSKRQKIKDKIKSKL